MEDHKDIKTPFMTVMLELIDRAYKSDRKIECIRLGTHAWRDYGNDIVTNGTVLTSINAVCYYGVLIDNMPMVAQGVAILTRPRDASKAM